MDSRLDGRRPVDGLLKLISQTTRRRLVLAIAAAYMFPVVCFAALYRVFASVSDRGAGVADFARTLYFSLITQATVGFGDLVPRNTSGRLLVGIQVLIGVSWTAFLPAVALIRLTQPDSGSFFLSSNMAFDPESGRFAIRYASFSKLTVFHIDIMVWIKVLSPRVGEFNNNPVKIRSTIQSHRRFANVRTKVPFIVYTDPAAVEAAFPEHVADVALHPAHLARWANVPQDADSFPIMVDIVGDASVGPVHVFHEYHYDQVLCGSHRNVQSDPGGPKEWKNFDIIIGREDTFDGKLYCRERCRYRDTCGLKNKVPMSV